MDFSCSIRCCVKTDPLNLFAVLHLPGQGEVGFSWPDPEKPELVHTSAGFEQPLERILFETERQHRRGAVLLGETGSGKSAFLDAVARRHHLPPRLTPVKIDVAADGDPDAVISRMTSPHDQLLVIDALDDIDDPENRRRLVEAIRNSAEHHRDARWIVASQHIAWDSAALAGLFAEFHLRPMDREQSERLAGEFCRQLKIEPEELLSAFDRLRHSRECAFMAGYPGQLQILCRAWARHRELPDSRSRMQEIARELGEPSSIVDGLGAWTMLGDRSSPSIASLATSDVSFVKVDGGRFLMGSPDDEEGRWRDEGPRHEVTVRPFLLAATAVTNLQYERFLAASSDAVVPAYWGDPRFNNAQQPVVGVSWEDARAFASWAGGRLPSEAEWEYACRAGSDEPRYGDLDEIAWWTGNSGGRLHSVGTRSPNRLGLYDMIGNVWEYVEDDRHDSYDGAPADDAAWVDEPRGARRLLRGGSWSDVPRVTRCTTRLTNHPGPRVGNVGFRIARSPFPPARL